MVEYCERPGNIDRLTKKLSLHERDCVCHAAEINAQQTQHINVLVILPLTMGHDQSLDVRKIATIRSSRNTMLCKKEGDEELSEDEERQEKVDQDAPSPNFKKIRLQAIGCSQ